MNSPRVIAEKLILAFFIADAAMVGLAPVIFYLAPENHFLGPFKLLSCFAALGAFVAAVYFFAADSDLPLAHGPSGLEYLLRALAAVSFWGFLGVIWFNLYAIVYWIARLIRVISIWVNGPRFSASSVAFYISFAVALMIAVGIAAAIAQNITNRFYSIKVTSRIASYNQVLRGQAKTWVYSALSLAAIFLMLFLISRPGRSWGFWTYYGFQWIPYVSCAWLLGLGARVRKDADIVDAVGRLLKAMDYEVVFSPRVTDPAFQSLVAGLDIVATKENRALVVQVKTLSSSVAPVDWTAGSTLLMKAQALEFPAVREMLDLPILKDTETVNAILVLAGRAQDPSLEAYATKESLPVAIVEMEGIEKILKTQDPGELRELADQYFHDLKTFGNQSLMVAPDQGLVKEGQWAS